MRMASDGGIPPQVLYAFGFMMVMLAIAGINMNIVRGRREAKRAADMARIEVRQEAQSIELLRQRALKEALWRDSSLADSSDPEVLARLATAVTAMEEELRLRDDVEALQRLHSEEAAHVQLQALMREAELAETDRIASLPAIRRPFAKSPFYAWGILAFTGILILIGGVWLTDNMNRRSALSGIADSITDADWAETPRWDSVSDALASLALAKVPCTSVETRDATQIVAKEGGQVDYISTRFFCDNLRGAIVTDWGAFLAEAGSKCGAENTVEQALIVGPNWAIQNMAPASWPVEASEVAKKLNARIIMIDFLEAEATC